jgi:very-short-patch-repair endonuclease
VPATTPDVDRRLLVRASEHHGLISGAEALRLGLTQKQIDRRVAQGRWDRLHPGVFRIAGCPTSDRQALAAAVLWTGGAASHSSAGALLDLTHTPRQPHVTVHRNATGRRRGLVTHRSSDLAAVDLTRLEGIRCTNATRTCIDLGAHLTEPQLERVIDRALHLGLTHTDRLITRFLQLARRGRVGTTTVRSVLSRIDPALAPAESDLESMLIGVLRRHGLPAPARQHRVTIDGHRFRIDLCYPEQLLAIESDGFAHHGHRHAFEHDRFRQNLLVLAGWRVLRFTWRQICSEPADVAGQVAVALAERT